jgi:hypothetical protein
MSQTRTTTRSRIARASAALFGSNVDADEQDAAVIDLLANLRHYCDHHQFDFAKLDRLAYQHYIAEVQEARCR